MMARVSDKIRRQLLNFSARQRVGMDFIVRLIWCECREGNPTKSKSWEDWCDIEMDWYGAANGGTPDRELHTKGYGTENDCYLCFNTPRRGLRREWLDAIQAFIDTHTFRDITQAKMEIAADLLDDCCATTLNIVHELYYWPAEMKRSKAQRDAIFEAKKAGKVSTERHATKGPELFPIEMQKFIK